MEKEIMIQNVSKTIDRATQSLELVTKALNAVIESLSFLNIDLQLLKKQLGMEETVNCEGYQYEDAWPGCPMGDACKLERDKQ